MCAVLVTSLLPLCSCRASPPASPPAPSFRSRFQENICSLSDQVEYYMKAYDNASIVANVGYEVRRAASGTLRFSIVALPFDWLAVCPGPTPDRRNLLSPSPFPRAPFPLQDWHAGLPLAHARPHAPAAPDKVRVCQDSQQHAAQPLGLLLGALQAHQQLHAGHAHRRGAGCLQGGHARLTAVQGHHPHHQQHHDLDAPPLSLCVALPTPPSLLHRCSPIPRTRDRCIQYIAFVPHDAEGTCDTGQLHTVHSSFPRDAQRASGTQDSCRRDFFSLHVESAKERGSFFYFAASELIF